MAIIKVITPSVTDANITTAKVTDNAITLAKMASGTDGNIISYDASGNPVAIATGSDGQVLTSTGAGSPPAFEALPGGGKIGQVVSETKVSTFLSNSDTMVDISGLAVAITPSATSSKVLVMVNFNVGVTATDRFAVFQLVRGSTAISIGASSGNRTVGSVAHVRTDAGGTANQISEYSINFLDSPSTTSATTYKMQGLAQSDDNPAFHLNMSGGDANAVHGFRLASTITAMEVLA
jgi:hypothetical protein